MIAAKLSRRSKLRFSQFTPHCRPNWPARPTTSHDIGCGGSGRAERSFTPPPWSEYRERSFFGAER